MAFKRLDHYVRAPHFAACPAARLYHNGGDEFVMLSTTADAVLRTRLAAMLAHLASPVVIDGSESLLRVLAGLARFLEDAPEFTELMRRADLAMMQSKRERAGAVRRDEAAFDRAARRRVSIGAGLRRAIGNDEFELHYPPKARARDGSLAAAEALVRWRMPEAEERPVSPSEFPPIAEECGLMPLLDRWIAGRLRMPSPTRPRWRPGAWSFRSPRA